MKIADGLSQNDIYAEKPLYPFRIPSIALFLLLGDGPTKGAVAKKAARFASDLTDQKAQEGFSWPPLQVLCHSLCKC